MNVLDKAVLRAEVTEDQDGIKGLYIVPRGDELCLTEAELRVALAEIESE